MLDQPTAPLATIQLPVRKLLAEVIEGPDASLSAGGVDALTIGTGQGNGLTLTDTSVSRFHLEIARSPYGLSIVDCGSTNGTFIGAVRIERAVVQPGTVVRIGRTSLRLGHGESETLELHAQNQLGDILGNAPSIRRLMVQLERAATSRVTTLLIGESGTGKELFARAIHDCSDRKKGPLVIVDCGALSSGLIASELFGHERGAFTGADRQYAGAFERADGGTLFLDEIGELPPELQVNLLGAIERRRFRRVGGKSDIAVDIRIVSATNRDLRAEVNAAKFRLDLYHRLSVVTLKVPPLRERADDIPLLIEHFLRACGCDEPLATYFPPDKLAELTAHYWPGNVRELRNVVEATVALGESPRLDGFANQPASATSAPKSAAADEQPYRQARAEVLNEFEARYLRRLYERSGGNVSQAARLARMDRSHLITLLERHDIR